jgi:hypothetical protein
MVGWDSYSCLFFQQVPIISHGTQLSSTVLPNVQHLPNHLFSLTKCNFLSIWKKAPESSQKGPNPLFTSFQITIMMQSFAGII